MFEYPVEQTTLLENDKVKAILELEANLGKNKKIVKAEKGQFGNRAKKEDAEKEIRRLQGEITDSYKLLVGSGDPSMTHLFLQATGLLNEDTFIRSWREANEHVDLKQSLSGMMLLSLNKYTLPTLSNFPNFTFTIEIKFTLAKPYLSKNDNDFYIIDNPIQRDKVFQVPMMRPSGWKGSLSAACYQSGCLPEDPRWKRLFGEVSNEDDAIGKAGRLHIYPSFFFATSLELINPHDRKTKAGKNPIMFEAVKQGSDSTFSLLYFPFDRIGDDFEQTKSQVTDDIKILLPGLAAMFTVFGFGAKTSSGYGVAKDACNSTIHLKGKSEPLVASSFKDLSSEAAIASVLDHFQG